MKRSVGLAVLCCALAFFSNRSAVRYREHAHKIKTSPQSIKVADLSAKGPGDNPNVVLTDFEFRTNDVYVSVWEKNRDNMTGGAYFPLEPKQKPKAAGDKKLPRVVVIAGLKTPAEVKAFMRRTTITGVVKSSTFADPYQENEPTEWKVEGRTPEVGWFVWADEHPEKLDAGRSLQLSYGLGLAALGFRAAGTLAWARGGERPRPPEPQWKA